MICIGCMHEHVCSYKNTGRKIAWRFSYSIHWNGKWNYCKIVNRINVFCLCSFERIVLNYLLTLVNCAFLCFFLSIRFAHSGCSSHLQYVSVAVYGACPRTFSFRGGSLSFHRFQTVSINDISFYFIQKSIVHT